MAKVLGKTSILSACDHSQKKNKKGGGSLYSRRIPGICFKEDRFTSLKMKSMALRCDFNGQRVVYLERKIVDTRRFLQVPLKVQIRTGLIGKTPKWWETGLQPNMKEVTSAQDLVDALFDAGYKLVILDFYSPACGGCKALFPKTCQLAKMNPDSQFLQVNYEEHKSMCYSLNVHVLPFFRFYRGAQGRLCQFSCTNATIQKFKNALAKHTTDQCSLGPAKGLDEKELLALAANKDLSFTYKPKPVQPNPYRVPAKKDILVSKTCLNPKESEGKTLVGAGG
ncbi:thioredoxin-like 1-1, chloroplastic isoform X2 [Hibiscus syriacus]|uniref:thioredoxin-like 1-1, chloroplastic isoform X2 n=1 Tax=Hibiscus syriacus TaxID=106335 RepID=UPI001921A236|nr:thioredoxin-like 1-1, chloroplastic isoform X2 [Hibiscus syriacus]